MAKKIILSILALSWLVLLCNVFLFNPKVRDFGYAKLSFSPILRHYVVNTSDTTIVVCDDILMSRDVNFTGLDVTYIQFEGDDYKIEYSIWDKEKLTNALYVQRCTPALYVMLLLTLIVMLIFSSNNKADKKGEGNRSL